MNYSNDTKTFCFILTILFLLSINTYETKAQSKLKSAIAKLFKSHKKKYVTKAFSNNNESKEIEQDDFELSILQEIEKTKDPALGYPPTERLQFVRDLVDNSPVARGIQGIQWSERGPTNVAGRTRAILFDPNDLTSKSVYAGAADGGLWFTNDITAANQNWNHISGIWDNLAISCIAGDPNTNTNGFHDIFVGTGESWTNPDAVRGNGIYLNTGSGFAPLTPILPPLPAPSPNTADFFYVNKIIVNPIPGGPSSVRIYVGTNTGLWQLTRGGIWSRVTNGIVYSGNLSDKVTDIEIAGTSPNIDFYVSFGWNGFSNGVYKLASGASV